MRFFVGILFVFLLLTSCQDIQKSDKPKDLISQDKMVDVLTEIALLNGARTYNKKMLKEKGIDPYEHLWEKFEVDSSQFRRSNNYYSENYKVYSKIYSRVKERLESFQLQYDSLREIEERKKDSLRSLIEDSLNPDRRRKILDSLKKKVPMELLPPPITRDDSKD